MAAELSRLGREGESIGGRTLPEVATAEPSARDAVEVWGRRIGRVLGWAFAAFLLIQLLRIYAP